MSKTNFPTKKTSALLLAASATLLTLTITTPRTHAQNATATPDTLVPWDGGYAATQKQFSTPAAATTPAPANPQSPTPAPQSAPALSNLAAAQVINWTLNLDNLLLRLGELRLENLNANNGGDLHYNGNLWARAYASRVNADTTLTGASLHQYTYGATIGADKTLAQNDTLTLLAGLMADYNKTTRTFDNTATGSTQDAGIGLYITLLADNGWFADLAARYDGIKTKFTTPAPITGSYTTGQETLSLELGRTYKRADGWWVEPSLQAAIAWAGSGATTPTPATHLAINSARDLQYRAAIRFGRQLTGTNLYPYASLAMAKVDTTGGAITVPGAAPLTPAYDGLRAELGLGAIYRIDEFNQLYLDYNYAKAVNYDSPWAANLGYRLLW